MSKDCRNACIFGVETTLEDTSMRTSSMLAAALLLGAPLANAVACEGMEEAKSTPVVVAQCSGSGCATVQPTTSQPDTGSSDHGAGADR